MPVHGPRGFACCGFSLDRNFRIYFQRHPIREYSRDRGTRQEAGIASRLSDARLRIEGWEYPTYKQFLLNALTQQKCVKTFLLS